MGKDTMKNRLSIQTSAQPAAPVQKSITMLFEAWRDYKNTQETEITKRVAIASNREINVAKIKAQRDVVEQYLIHSFSERRQVITGMFETLDKGIANGDERIIGMAMQSIVETIKTSPLQGIQNMMQQLDDPNIDAIEI